MAFSAELVQLQLAAMGLILRAKGNENEINWTVDGWADNEWSS